jgi:hypothetical protein
MVVGGAPEDAAFRSIGNAGCEVEPADSAMVFGIQKAEERRFVLCWVVITLDEKISCVMRQ